MNLDELERSWEIRNEAIYDRSLTGASYVEIGRAFGLCGARIGQIVKQQAADADRWCIGARLVPSERGIWQITLKPSLSAVIVGKSSRPDCVRVLVDGRKTAASYSKAFWTPAPTE